MSLIVQLLVGLTVMWSNSLKVVLLSPELLIMWSECFCMEPLFHSQAPSWPTETTWPSRFLKYAGPLTPYLWEEQEVAQQIRQRFLRAQRRY